MYTDFEKLPAHSKIWIYQCNRELTDTEEDFMNKSLKENIEDWVSHGNSLLGSFAILHKRFVVVALNPDYNDASGCSIDSSSRWFKEINVKLNIDFFDRTQLYLSDNNLNGFSIFEAKKMVISGKISPETLIFNNNICTLEELNTKWKIPAEESYLAKYFEMSI